MSEVLINGVHYVPRAEIPKLTDERLVNCLGYLMEIQYFKQDHKSRAIAWNALHALSPELAQLASDDESAAYDRVKAMGLELTNEDIKEKEAPVFTRDEMLQMLPVIVSDLKHNENTELQRPINKNIRRGLFQHVIRSLYEEHTFLHNQVEPDCLRVGTFVKGYVRDVWDYLHNAYEMIHEEDFEQQIIKEQQS